MEVIDSLKAWSLKSGLVSIKIFFPLLKVTKLEQRVRLFFGLFDLHVEQSHPMTGVPALDPAPRMVNLIDIDEKDQRSFLKFAQQPYQLSSYEAQLFFLQHKRHWKVHSFFLD